MILLDKHIEILLLDNDCVIVPGLGGFMAHHAEARYYADTQTFLPPMRQLGFNANVQINDSLLAQSYIEAYDISYPEAIRRINEEVEELKQVLRNEGSCELNDIGVLKQNIEGNIEFEPCEAGILTPELYGLNSVDVAPLKIATAESNKAQNIIIGNTFPVPNNIEQSQGADGVVDDEEERTIKIKISTIRNVATAAAVILALFIFSIPLSNSQQVRLTESYVDTGILYNLLPAELRETKTVREKVEFHKSTENKKPVAEVKATEIKIEGNDTPVEVKVAEEKPVVKEYYSIVLASRVTKANAEEYVQKLKKNGYDEAELVERSNGLKVIYGRFASQQEAYNFLHNIRKDNETFKDGWIMKF